MPRALRGSASPRAKLTEKQVREILKLDSDYGAGRPVPRHFLKGADNRLNIAAIAREYHISEGLVRGILTGRNWGWLTEY